MFINLVNHVAVTYFLSTEKARVNVSLLFNAYSHKSFFSIDVVCQIVRVLQLSALVDFALKLTHCVYQTK